MRDESNREAALRRDWSLGFLQHGRHKTVLRRAWEGLARVSSTVQDHENRLCLIRKCNRWLDRDVTDFMSVRVRGVGTSHQNREHMSGQATRPATAEHITRGSLTSLESLVRSASELPGQKLLFFLSNGFFVRGRNSDVRDRLQKITSLAARNGVVVYSLDTRGLVSALVDASTDAPFDPSFSLRRTESEELNATQDGLHALAYDTGGRTILTATIWERV